MRSFVLPALTLSVLVITALAAAGCVSDNSLAGNTSATHVPANFTPGQVAEMRSMDDIDRALASGPVLVEFGADWCSYCVKQKPITARLARDYPGVTFADVNTDDSQVLADHFYVNGIPQMNIIVRKNDDGSYLYIDEAGKKSTDRYRSAIVGYRERGELQPLIEAATAARAQ